MAEISTVLFFLVLVLVLALHIFRLPANWILLALVAFWRFTYGTYDLTAGFFLFLIILAVLGEIFEYATRDRKNEPLPGPLAGVVGGVVFGLLLAPLLWGGGALIGVLLGVYIGATVFNLFRGDSFTEARKKGVAAFRAGYFPAMLKFSMGAAMFMQILMRIQVT